MIKGMFKGVAGTGKNLLAGFNFSPSMGSIGTALTAAGTGAVIGGAIGGSMNTEDPLATAAKGAGIGAAAGSMAVPAVGMAARGVYEVGRGVGKAAPAVAKGVLSGTAKVGGAIGSSVFSAATGSVIPGANPIARGISTLANPVGRYAGAAKNLTKSMVKVTEADPLKGTRGKIGFSKIGKGVLLGGAAIGAVKRSVDTSNTIRQGRRDGMVHTATPRVPAYADNAGATGDLAFALHANRRG